MPSILFVCTGNFYRSPLAAAFFLKKLKDAGLSDDWVVESAGTWTIPGQHLPNETVWMAEDFGLDLRSQTTQLVSAELLSRFDLIVVMEQGHREALKTEFPFIQDKLYLISEVVHELTYDIPDPANSGRDLEIFVPEFYKFMERGFEKIYQLARVRHL